MPLGRWSITPGRRPLPSTLGSGDGRNYWNRGRSHAVRSTGTQYAARKKWHPWRDDHRHGADGTPAGAASVEGAAVGGGPTTRQACANHGVLALDRYSSNRPLLQSIFANRIPSKQPTGIGSKLWERSKTFSTSPTGVAETASGSPVRSLTPETTPTNSGSTSSLIAPRTVATHEPAFFCCHARLNMIRDSASEEDVLASSCGVTGCAGWREVERWSCSVGSSHRGK
jgi:hypothetical protein